MQVRNYLHRKSLVGRIGPNVVHLRVSPSIDHQNVLGALLDLDGFGKGVEVVGVGRWSNEAEEDGEEDQAMEHPVDEHAEEDLENLDR